MINALFAIDETNGMGFNGTMPWPRVKEDMIWFKNITQRQTVVMGRKTWDSADMPSPLPGRTNVLVTNTFIANEDIVQIRGDICAGILKIQQKLKCPEIFIIGGADILRQTLPITERVYLTRIKGEYINDTFIDIDAYLKDFTLVETHPLGSCHVEEFHR
jgi:dihydrofolate reductase